VTPVQKRSLIVAAGIAAAAEGLVIYRQWPSPPLKVCAYVELGELLAKAAKADAELREARTRMRREQGDAAAKQLLRMEAVAAVAATEVAIYRKQAQERQKASGAGTGACR